jgi:lipoic acid synthetase
VLHYTKEYQSHCFTKSGLMVGIGEEPDEILTVMEDLRNVGCDFLTIGQYLRPSFNHYPIIRHVRPEEFDEYKEIGERMGFTSVFSSRLVRSSFMAGDFLKKATACEGPKP